MRSRILSTGEHGRTLALIFEDGDEVIDALSAWCREEQLPAARFTAIGAFREATLGWYDYDAQEYRDIQVTEQTEVVALTGDVARDPEGVPTVHAHAVLTRFDGTALGGHLRRGVVRPTLELIIDVVPSYLRKRSDPKSGLALIDPHADPGV